ncbi:MULTISPECIES: hypothetical protein [Rhodococcus]|uniref:hypothetical protein n=1 Tax=Rhodococcus TaxID=1827 RepID=UPI0012EB7033|nr:hypothetical protein [Rhodococcus sp. BH4]
MVPMLRQNVIVHEISLSSGTPWHVYIAAVIGGLIAIGGWLAVHYFSKKRDLDGWRRTALLEAVSALVASSISRRDHITTVSGLYDRFTIPPTYTVPDEARKALRDMMAARHKIEICAENSILRSADQIIELHTNSALCIERLQRSFFYPGEDGEFVRLRSPEGIIGDERDAEIDIDELTKCHAKLIRSLQIEIRLKKKQL